MRPRDYQQEAVDSVYRFFAAHPDPSRNPVIAMPTGTGKAVVIAWFCYGVLSQWPSQRVMMLTHVKELIEQNADKMLAVWPQAPIGIFSAGLGEKSAHRPITFAGIQSAAKAPHLFGHQDIILVDECHLVSPSETASYKKFIAELRKVNPWLRVIGLSATAYRLGLGMITDGGVFTDICYDITGLRAFNRLLDEGYLAPLIPMTTKVELDVSGVHKHGGEFIAKELQAAVGREGITREALAETIEAARDRRHWLIFAAGIEHVELIARLLDQMGVSSTYVHSKLSSRDRDDNLARFKAGQVRALVNADILTTGFDFPGLDCIVLLRPTSSPGLHVQILGRGTRPFYAPGFDLSTTDGRLAAIANSIKQNCLVLDFAGNTRRLGPINDPRIPGKKGEGNGQIPVKVCDECGCMAHISARECPNCGTEFTFQEKIAPKASTLALIVRDEPQVELFTVDRIVYAPHVKPGFPPSLKVSYYCGVRRFTEWVCLQHHGNPIQHKAHAWWRARIDLEPPLTVDAALPLVDKLKVPKSIRVWVNRKYPEILSYVF
jgi:DNA repair protein RadD